MNPEETRILLVDDDPTVRDMIELILQSADYVVETAGNGLEALEKNKTGAGFHVMITDLNMPEMDGLSLIQEVRKTDSNIAIILMSGDDASAPESGVDAVVAKDENIMDIIGAAVEAAIEKKGVKG